MASKGGEGNGGGAREAIRRRKEGRIGAVSEIVSDIGTQNEL